MGTIRIAAAAAHFGRDLPRSLERIEMVLNAARKAEAALVVLPDAALGGYQTDVGPPGHGVSVPVIGDGGRELGQVAELAGELIVCIGYTETSATHRWRSAVCLSGDRVYGRYRKVHQSAGEELAYSAGAELAAFDTPVGRMGMLIDYDKTFPEAARTVALDGARIVACLSAWPASVTQRAERIAQDRQSRLFDLYDCARAAENQIVWVSANQTGSIGALRFLGQAKVVGPGGEVLARTGAKAGLAVAEVDVDGEIDRARLAPNHLGERRPELYAQRSGM